MSQQEMFPTKPAPAPIAVGDTIITNGYQARHRVQRLDDNIHGLVFVCVNLDTGNDSIIFEREVGRHIPH